MSDQTHNEYQPDPQGDTTFISSPSVAARSLLPGDIVDNSYQLTKLLGRGGMGVVYSCHQAALRKNFALKLLNADQLSGAYWTRFQAEARALAKLNHPGIVRIHNMGIDAGLYPYFVMDLLSGETLESLIQSLGRLPVDQALDFFIQISDALSSAHGQGIIHRDIKPSNLMLVRDSKNQITTIKIVDFGIARLPKETFSTQSQTATGLIFGTPFYMSPEQCQGKRVDERSDIYSLGCALFEALTGRPPFVGDNSFTTFMMHQTETPPRLASRVPTASFPQSLELAVGKMLAKRTSERYQTMAQVGHDLERIRDGKEIMTRNQITAIAPVTEQKSTNVVPSQADRIGVKRDAKSDTRRGFKEAPLTGSHTWSKTAIVSLISTILAVICGTCAIFALRRREAPVQPVVRQPISSKQNELDDNTLIGAVVGNAADPFGSAMNLGSDDDFKRIGASEKEIAEVRKYDFLQLVADEKTFPHVLVPYLNRKLRLDARFKTQTPRPKFQFPTNIIIGFIQFGNDKPLAAIGNIAIPAGKFVRFYLNHATRGYYQILGMFGPEDLNSLEIVSDEPAKVIEKVCQWQKLDDLSFFNSLEKSMPGYNKWDESPITDDQLPQLEQLSHLHSLGLCGDHITGPAILKMPLVKRLSALKIKRIKNIEPLLRGLASLPNIRELWLVTTYTTDEQLKLLARMKNLETLRIRRSSLTPSSLKYFKMMPALKHLYLDRAWSDKDKDQFKKAIPGCQFEPVVDFSYWQRIPDSPAKNNAEPYTTGTSREIRR